MTLLLSQLHCTCEETGGKAGIAALQPCIQPSAKEGLYSATQLWLNAQTSTMLYATSTSSPFGGGHRDSHAEPISVQTSKIEVSRPFCVPAYCAAYRAALRGIWQGDTLAKSRVRVGLIH